MMDIDVDAIDRVEAELDAFIEKRAREKANANRVDEFWDEQDRRHRERQREENRRDWCDFHRQMQTLHLGLAAEHASRRSRLLAESGYELDETPGPEAA
jgi:hypothetical protein